jgi:hypothetical protein
LIPRLARLDTGSAAELSHLPLLETNPTSTRCPHPPTNRLHSVLADLSDYITEGSGIPADIRNYTYQYQSPFWRAQLSHFTGHHQ